MKKSVVAAVAFAGLSILGSTGAFAQTAATQSIGLTAKVPSACTINGSATGVAGEIITMTTSGGAIAATTYNQPTAGGYGMSCNSPTTVQITSANDGLVNTSTLPGYTNIINYTATATIGGLLGNTTESFTTTGTGASRTSTGTLGGTYTAGTLTVAVTPAATSTLAPGTFNNTLTVTLTPQ